MNKYIVRTFITLGALAFFVAISAGLFWAYLVFSSDTEEKKYPNLQPDHTALSENSINGLDILSNIYEKLDASDEHNSWCEALKSKDNFQRSAELTTLHELTFDSIQSTFQHAIQSTWDLGLDADYSREFSLMGIGEFLQLLAKQHIDDVEWELAHETITTHLRFAKYASEMEGPLVTYLVQVAIYSGANTSVLQYAESLDSSTKRLEKVQEQYHEMPELNSKAINALKYEFQIMSNQVSEMAKTPTALLKPNMMISRFAESYQTHGDSPPCRSI